MKCEYCTREHDGKYATGRFCSARCSRSFSTKGKREIINRKISEKIKQYFSVRENREKLSKIASLNKHTQETKEKIAKGVKKHLKEHPRKSYKITKKWTDERRQRNSQLMIDRIINGKIKLTSKRCEYVFKDKLIRCDSKVEYSCLNYFEKEFNVQEISRCNFSIKYDYKGSTKNYVPDFIIKTNNQIFIVECKQFFWDNRIKNSLYGKWKFYYESFEYKKKALEEFCQQRGHKAFFYFVDMNKEFYYNLKLPVSPHSDKVLKG